MKVLVCVLLLAVSASATLLSATFTTRVEQCSSGPKQPCCSNAKGQVSLCPHPGGKCCGSSDFCCPAYHDCVSSSAGAYQCRPRVSGSSSAKKSASVSKRSLKSGGSNRVKGVNLQKVLTAAGVPKACGPKCKAALKAVAHAVHNKAQAKSRKAQRKLRRKLNNAKDGKARKARAAKRARDKAARARANAIRAKAKARREKIKARAAKRRALNKLKRMKRAAMSGAVVSPQKRKAIAKAKKAKKRAAKSVRQTKIIAKEFKSDKKHAVKGGPQAVLQLKTRAVGKLRNQLAAIKNAAAKIKVAIAKAVAKGFKKPKALTATLNHLEKRIRKVKAAIRKVSRWAKRAMRKLNRIFHRRR